MTQGFIHPTAIIEGEVDIADDVSIDAFTIIRGKVSIGKGTHIGPNVVIKGHTKIGERNKIFQFASVGEDCQDKKYQGEETWLEIGDDNVIREFTTLHRGTIQDNALTKIGNRNLFMAYSHIGHDCIIGDDCVLANGATLGGHVVLDDLVIIGGLSAVHQFCKVGKYAMLGGGSTAKKDVPAFLLVFGNPGKPRGLNLVGLERRGFEPARIKNLIGAYKDVYMRGKKLSSVLEEFGARLEVKADEDLALFVESIKSSTRGIIR